jgi:hypothetical protein
VIRHTFSIKVTGKPKQVWNVERLWQLAKDLPIKAVPLESISALDEIIWFGGASNERPTCRRVAEHAKRIYKVTFDYPIILSAAGYVMDGMHRIAKAYILGMKEIQGVQFSQDPEPDEILVDDEVNTSQ